MSQFVSLLCLKKPHYSYPPMISVALPTSIQWASQYFSHITQQTNIGEMAVLDSQPKIKVTVSVDGKALEEYINDDAKIKGLYTKMTVVRYIEAQSGKYFTVDLEVSKDFKPGTSLSFRLYVDGRWINGYFFVAEDYKQVKWADEITERETKNLDM
jgi:hypothetical protein